jgi:hypothetical protein
MPPLKGQSSKHEGQALDAQGHVVKARVKNQTLRTLLTNALHQLEQQDKDLEDTTKAVTKIRKREDEEG